MAPNPFKNQKYLNIETFRKNGQGVKTPVWFVQDGATVHAWTFAGSGKVKRIRRNGLVRIVPCTYVGEPRGEWVNAQAIVEDAPEAMRHVENLMKEKYGLSFLIFHALGKMRGTQSTTLKIQLA